ncbi:MAG: response regulator [Caulobacteraceae bacterium]|nr:response regulator [Caulobacter sp.]
MALDRAPGSFFYVLEDAIRILYVDDDPILREFAVVHLTSDTAQVRVAEDGEDGLAKIAEGDVDLVLLDLDMPRLDGFGVLRRLRADPAMRDLPVIVCTGREDVSAIDRAFEEGATAFTVKPVNWRLLAYQVQYVHRGCRDRGSLRRARDEARTAQATSGDALYDLGFAAAPLLQLAMAGGPELRAAAARFGAVLADACAAAPATPAAA